MDERENEKEKEESQEEETKERERKRRGGVEGHRVIKRCFPASRARLRGLINCNWTDLIVVRQRIRSGGRRGTRVSGRVRLKEVWGDRTLRVEPLGRGDAELYARAHTRTHTHASSHTNILTHINTYTHAHTL